MNEPHENPIVEEFHQVTAFGSRHRFMVLIAGVIIVSLLLVGVSMALYRTSGAALLDLSLPGLQSASKQITEPSATMEYPSTGPINTETLDQFRRLYDEQSRQATGVDSFSGDSLSDTALSIDAPEPAEQ